MRAIGVGALCAGRRIRSALDREAPLIVDARQRDGVADAGGLDPRQCVHAAQQLVGERDLPLASA